jgi:hypothetical protein
MRLPYPSRTGQTDLVSSSQSGGPSATASGVSIALDAAHIRWHQAGGPETESNGLVLCVLHHKTFDLGVFTVSSGVLLDSDQANGTAGFQESMIAYHLPFDPRKKTPS